jgi:hypothetical protein
MEPIGCPVFCFEGPLKPPKPPPALWLVFATAPPMERENGQLPRVATLPCLHVPSVMTPSHGLHNSLWLGLCSPTKHGPVYGGSPIWILAQFILRLKGNEARDPMNREQHSQRGLNHFGLLPSSLRLAPKNILHRCTAHEFCARMYR